MPRKRTASRSRRMQGTSNLILAILLAVTVILTGCSIEDYGEDVTDIIDRKVTDSVVLKVNNSCGNVKTEDTSSQTSSPVKGLSKVMNGFGIPYDEHATEFKLYPEPITNDSYEANKNRGIGYAGLESHYPANIHDGEQHVEKTPGSYVDFATLFDDLTSEEEMYGCCMRWEYVGGADYEGPGIDGYFSFLRGGGYKQRQYIAIHALNTDKWCICCPFDYGPAYDLPTTGGGQYADGRIGGVSPETAEALGFGGHGECPEEALTEWWWVENSSQVKVGPVENGLNSLTVEGSAQTSAGSTHTSTNNVSNSTKSDDEELMNANPNAKVEIAPTNSNSFVNSIRQDLQHGDLPANKVKYIVVHDGDDSLVDYASGMYESSGSANQISHVPHFLVSKNGKITQFVPINKISHHAGEADRGNNEKFGIAEERDDQVGKQGDNIDYAMNAWSVGVMLEHSATDTMYPETQLNALDKLIAYIDMEVGSAPQIIDHKSWAGNRASDCSVEFPLTQYQQSRNHNAVETVQDAMIAQQTHSCSDGDIEGEDGEIVSGGTSIVDVAVQIAGTASPEERLRGSGTDAPTAPELQEYVKAKQEFNPEAKWWADCGIAVSTVVRKAEADADFPSAGTDVMYPYLQSSDKWTEVGTLRPGDACDANLEPGDVCITRGKGHIMIYVGNEAVVKRFPNSNANWFEAQMETYYPALYNMVNMTFDKEYAIFRCTKPDVASATSKNGESGSTIRNKIVGYCRQQAANGATYSDSPSGGEENKSYSPAFLATCAYKAAGLTIPNWHGRQNGSGGQNDSVASHGNWVTDPSNLQPGDLVFFGANRYNTGHVGIAIGGGQMIDAQRDGVKVRDIASYGTGNFVGGGWPLARSIVENSKEAIKVTTKIKKSGRKKESDKDKSDDGKSQSSGSTSDVKKSNVSSIEGLDETQEKIAIALFDQGFDTLHVAAIMGNIWGESGYNPDIGEEYDSSAKDPNVERGYGLCQWTSLGRKRALWDLAASKNKDVSDIDIQIEHLTNELNAGFTGDYILKDGTHVFANKEGFDSATNLYDAVFHFQYGFERPEQGNQDGRTAEAERVYQLLPSVGGGHGTKVKRYVFIGDSRFVGMCITRHPDSGVSTTTDNNGNGTSATAENGKKEIWFAKGSMSIDWFNSDAVNFLNRSVQQGDAIIIWMGVNGAPSYGTAYADTIKQNISNWKGKGADVYYLSVGPVDEGAASSYGYSITNGAIDKFNTDLKNALSGTDVSWIDLQSQLGTSFGAPDGLHYDGDTYNKIYDIIIKNIVDGADEEKKEEEEEKETEPFDPRDLVYNEQRPL